MTEVELSCAYCRMPHRAHPTLHTAETDRNQTTPSELIVISYQLFNDSLRSISLYQVHSLVGFLFTDDVTDVIVVTHLFTVQGHYE